MSQVKGFPLMGYVMAGVLLLGFLVVSTQAEPEIRDVTLKLGGQSCQQHIVQVESALLRLRGITLVDIEARQGYVIVGYDSTMVSIAKMLQAVGSKRGEDWFCTAHVAAG
jgi:copper chaperone CopZ